MRADALTHVSRRRVALTLATITVLASAGALAWQGLPGEESVPPANDSDSGEAASFGPSSDGTPEPGEASGSSDGLCSRADVDAATRGPAPATVHVTHSVFSSLNRSVDVDNGTVVAALALMNSLTASLGFEDVVNFTEERVEVCALNMTAALSQSRVVSALALGVRIPPGALQGLAGDMQLFVGYHSVTRQNVTIDRDVARAVLAFGAERVPVEDVLDVQRETRVERVVTRATTVERGNVLALAALGCAPRAAEEGATVAPPLCPAEERLKI